MVKTVCMMGTFDSKGPEYAFLREQLLAQGVEVFAVNVGVMGSTALFPVDCEADEVAGAAGTSLAQLRERQDRGEAMKAMSYGAPRLITTLHQAGKFDGIIGMGGTGGTSVITAAMRALPIGVPKLCVSTAAAGDVAGYLGVKDIAMLPSIVDVAGINRISRPIFTRAAGAIAGMVKAEVPAGPQDERPIIAASMFGNTTECVNRCVSDLEEAGYEALVFHCTGTGGRVMESLVDEGLVDAVLDITTTEWADEVCGGVFSAGPDRLSAPGRRGIPHLIVPGCIDMANFTGIAGVPEEYVNAGRNLYEWNTSVALMRTNRQENARMGQVFAERANVAKGPVAFLIPTQGVSILDGDGEPFADRDADQAFVDALRKHLREDIPVEEVAMNINDTEFSRKAVAMMLDLLQ